METMEVDALLEKYKPKEVPVKKEESSSNGEPKKTDDEMLSENQNLQDGGSAVIKSNDTPDTPDISPLKVFLGDDLTLEEVKLRYTGWNDLSKGKLDAEAKLKEKDEELNSYKSFVEQAVNPSDFYANEEIRFLNEVIKKYPSLDYSVASRLVTQDAKELSDIEAITIAEAMENSDYGLRVDEAELKLLKRLGIESREDIENLSTTEKRLLAVDARKARAQIARTQEEVKKAPDRKTPEEFLSQHQATVNEVREASRKAYEPIIDALISKVEGKVEHGGKELTTIKLDEGYRAELRKFALEQIANYRMGVDEENQKAVVNNIAYKVWGDKRGEILSAAIADAETRITQELEQKYNNHQPVDLIREKPKETVDTGVSSLTQGLPKPGWG
jgi:hypothetical protein